MGWLLSGCHDSYFKENILDFNMLKFLGLFSSQIVFSPVLRFSEDDVVALCGRLTICSCRVIMLEDQKGVTLFPIFGNSRTQLGSLR